MSSVAARTWAELDLSAFAHNAAVARRHAGPGNWLMAVIKADAYGHGAVVAGRALEPHVDAFGVACVAEAVEVADSGVDRPIYILGPALPNEREEIVARGFIPAVSSAAEAGAYGAIAQRLRHTVAVHLVIDTGMGRIGALETDAVGTAIAVAQTPGLRLDSLASHFPSADEDADFTRDQLRRWENTVARVRAAGLDIPLHHIANSAGTLGYPRLGREMVRCGLMIYGVSPLPDHRSALRPVLTWKSRITQVRTLPAGSGVSYGRTFVTEAPTVVATVATGYADGYPRALAGRGTDVLVAGQRCPLLGRVTMDQIMVDVTRLPSPAQPGDDVTLIGRQGSAEITASELARLAGTIPWEILTGLGRRVRRIAL